MWRRASLAAALTGCGFQHGALPVDSNAGEDLLGTAGAHVRALDIDDSRVLGGPHAGFPLLVAITAPWLETRELGGGVARPDGYDIYFSADPAGAMRLAHEVEVYTPDTGVLVAWVKIPLFTPQTVVYLHYGDDSATTDPQDVHAVWSASFAGVFHQRALVDATGMNTTLQSTASGTADGRVDLASTFDGVDDIISLGSAAAVDDIFTGGGTVEAWYYARSYGENVYGRIFDKGHYSGWSLWMNNTEAAASMGFVHGTTSGNVGYWNTLANSITLNAWHHVALVYDQDAMTNDPLFYIDGAVVPVTRMATPDSAMLSDAAQDLTAGNRVALDRTFDGFLDEMRLSSVPRSADWIATEVKNQAEPAQFVAIGPEL